MNMSPYSARKEHVRHNLSGITIEILALTLVKIHAQKRHICPLRVYLLIETQWGERDISETRVIQISEELWMRLRRIVANRDFSIDDLVESILNDVDLEDYAKELAAKARESINTEEREVQETEEKRDEEEAAEEADEEETEAEEADDRAENRY